MEKGSFQTSVKSIHEIDDFAENLPLPNQVPPTPAFPQSRAVETLLGQNSDLMARLSVSIRNGSQLETRVNEIEQENAHLKHKYDSVKDQLLVTQEKDRLVNERNQAAGVESERLQEKLKLLEKKYTEVYAHSKEFQRQLGRLRNYRYRMQKAIASFKQNLAKMNAQKRRQHEQEIIQMGAEYSEAQVGIVNRYEAELSQMRGEIELLRRRAADRDQLYETKIRIENQLIFEQRQAHHYRTETSQELQSTKEENLDLRDQLKKRVIEVEHFERDLSVALERLENFKREEKERTDQIESLQLLWKEKQAEVERLEEKNRSLQKLNQQLSVTINSQRKDIVDAKSEIEKVRFEAGEKIRALEKVNRKS